MGRVLASGVGALALALIAAVGPAAAQQDDRAGVTEPRTGRVRGVLRHEAHGWRQPRGATASSARSMAKQPSG